MAFKLQARILKLQTLNRDTHSTNHEMKFESSFSVLCPETMQVGQGVFEME